MDALHGACAEQAGVGYFLTCDDRVIRKYKGEMKVINPIGFVLRVIPVAGVGSRLRPHTHTRPKPLLPVAGQPILGPILDPLLAVGIRRVVLVTGHMGEQIVEYVRGYGESGREWSSFGEVAGSGPPISHEPMLVVYGDTIFQADLRPVLERGMDGMLGVKPVEDPGRFGVVVEEEGGAVLGAFPVEEWFDCGTLEARVRSSVIGLYVSVGEGAQVERVMAR